ncbi:MAG: hypothetical protein EAZ85_01665 [Bacteroidetes bacterium]|nr:MAG: hypothetical protein EAZ85_01665 [Bacteroidota bacterium]TAG89940.1 MAG: hypothetical protein EAZ20_05410 [Bacteroidota bacterium]
MNKILLYILGLSFCLISCNDENQEDLSLKERELKLREQEIESKRENKNIKEDSNNKQADKYNEQPNIDLSEPETPPKGFNRRYVSKNYYGNGHNEYLFIDDRFLGKEIFQYYYYSTNTKQYIPLNAEYILVAQLGQWKHKADYAYKVTFNNGSSYIIFHLFDGNIVSLDKQNYKEQKYFLQ